MKRHLLNDETDPFNRAPLKFGDLKVDENIKRRIEIWIEQKKAGVETDEDKRIKEEEAKASSPMQIDKSEV